MEIDEKYIDMIIDIIDDNKGVVCVLSNDTALEIVEQMELDGLRFNEEHEFSLKEAKELFESEVLMLSKYTINDKEYYHIENVFYEDKVKPIGDCSEDIVIIESGLEDMVKITEQINEECEIMLVSQDEECLEVDEVEELIDLAMGDILLAINNQGVELGDILESLAYGCFIVGLSK